MALRSLGSSLVAKAAPGSALRKTTEQRILTPEIPGKGAPGSLERQFIEEPTLRPISAGSQRITTPTPTIESVQGQASLPPDLIAPAPPLPVARPGAEGQPLFQGGVTPTAAAPVARGGRVATSVSGGPVPETTPAQGPAGQVQGASTQVQAAPSVTREGLLPTIFSFLSGRTVADEPQRPTQESSGFGATGVQRQGNEISFTPTAGQLLAGISGKALTSVGTALKAPQLAPGGLGARLQAFGGNVGPAIAGQGSISAGLRSLTSSVGKAASNLRSKASNAFSYLRSKLSR